MSRIFLSRSSENNAEAIALRDWLVAEGWDDLFLDLDPSRGITAGDRWERSLNEAAHGCHHLDARQMRRHRSAIHPALGGGDRALGRCGLFALGFARGNDVVGLFQSEQLLIFRQCLRPAAEAMALHLP